MFVCSCIADPETLSDVVIVLNFVSAIVPSNIAFVTVPYCKVPPELTCNTVLLLPLLMKVVEPLELCFIISSVVPPAIFDAVVAVDADEALPPLGASHDKTPDAFVFKNVLLVTLVGIL